MNFQDKLNANYRTKREIEEEKRKREDEELCKQAEETINNIKERLIAKAHEGETYIENGITKVFVCVPIPFDCLRQEKIEGEATYKETFRGVWVLAEPGKTKTIYNINQTEKLNVYMRYLRQLAELDDIEIVKFVLYISTYRNYDFHYDLPYISNNEINCHIGVKCQVAIDNNKKIQSTNDFPDSNLLTNTNSPSNETYVDVDNMEGHVFEQFCAKILLKNDFDSVVVTSDSGDQGVDIIAIRDGVKYGIQCKCYSSDIGNSAVQEVYAGKTYYNCHVGVVLTNRYFTRSAKDLSDTNGILLWDRKKLLKMIEKAGLKNIAD